MDFKIWFNQLIGLMGFYGIWFLILAFLMLLIRPAKWAMNSRKFKRHAHL